MKISKELGEKLFIALFVGVASALVVDEIRRRRNKQTKVPSSTDHNFSNWVGDNQFFEIEGDNSVERNRHMKLADIGRKNMIMHTTRYTQFNVSPAKPIRVTT